MPVIDSEGRVFGRFNLVDALLVLLLMAALPLGYGAHRLFRDPPAQLLQISPSALSQGSAQPIELTGEHFRPYMRVSFGDRQGASFMFYGPRQAFVPVPPLEPGTYDIVLYDYMREVARLPGALTITGPVRPPLVQIQVSGAFTGLTGAGAAQIKAEQMMNATEGVVATILSVGAPRLSVARVQVSEKLVVPVPMHGLLEVPATIVLNCPTTVGPGGVLHCATAGATLKPDANVALQGPAGYVLFRIDRIDGPVNASAGKAPQ